MNIVSNEEKIEWKICNNCGLLQYKTHFRCLKCKSNDFKLIEASGPGKLLTYTVLKAPPAEFQDKKSYTLGIVEFSNGIKALGQINIQKDLKIGMQLKPVFKQICENLDGHEVYSYVFETV